jgi:hypothetical protein
MLVAAQVRHKLNRVSSTTGSRIMDDPLLPDESFSQHDYRRVTKNSSTSLHFPVLILRIPFVVKMTCIVTLPMSIPIKTVIYWDRALSVHHLEAWQFAQRLQMGSRKVSVTSPR